MKNHVHLIVMPKKKSNNRRARIYPGNEFEQHERTGRPLGDEGFIEKAERLLHRALKKRKPGPKGGGRIN
jgi:predicted RNA polymerase sigma factor